MKKRILSNSDGIPAPRTPLHIEVSFKKSYSRKDSQGVLKNISISGAFLVCNEGPFKKEEKLSLTFEVSGRARSIQAQVVWINGAGAGIQFLPQNNRDVQIVDDLIYFVESKRTGTKDILDKILKKVA